MGAGDLECCPHCGDGWIGQWWYEERPRANDQHFEAAQAMVRFVGEHLPAEGGPWHLDVVDCAVEEVGGARRTLRGLLRQLPRVASWHVGRR